MQRLSLLDSSFLFLERSHQPMHIGGLYLFDLPADAPANWLGQLREQVKAQSDSIMRPFNLKLARRFGQYHWTEDDDVDVDYHIRHTALPAPGRYRELFELIGNLHSTRLDRERPLWEAQIIEGIENNQWALYTKVHHAVVDGIGGVRLIRKMFSDDPNERSLTTPWTRPANAQPVNPESREALPVLRVLADNIQQQLGSMPGVIGALRKHFKILNNDNLNQIAPFEAPRTVLNGRVRVARRFVAQSYAMARIRAVGKRLDATVNDIVLAMCAGALRTWLSTWSDLPSKPLTVMVPVGLSKPDDPSFSNAVAMICASLATNVADPVARLQAIQASVKAGKDMLAPLSRSQVEMFTSLASTPALLPSVLGLGGRTPPPFNVTISNVPGPRSILYCNGARLRGYYPVSIPLDGAVLNITVTSYVDDLCFGITTCRRSMPRAQKLIEYLENALQELETAAA